MAKILIYGTGFQGRQESLQIEQAMEEYINNNDVYFLHCDNSMRFCIDNPEGNTARCRVCMWMQSINRRHTLDKRIKVISIKDNITTKIMDQAAQIFSYNNGKELMEIEYHGVEIGMGAMSTYISLTRNLAPKINIKTKPYFDLLLKEQILLTLVLEKLNYKHNFDKIIFHNGRFAQYKPLLNFAESYGIEFICTESNISKYGKVIKNNFYNTIPHEMTSIAAKIMGCWAKSTLTLQEKESIGKDFFERKREAKATGDKVYTENQKRGYIIESWNPEKENIIIFNSSEDEFTAIGKSFNKRKLFESQLSGIKTILNRYGNDETKHFYLRIHPNLKDVDYKFHKNLYKLTYPNLTVIAASSSVDTYTLIDRASKIIVFGSTVGIEGSYARKPVICLGPASYNELDVVYIPKNINELWDFIDNKNLGTKYNINVLKFGFYQMAMFDFLVPDKCKYINNDVYRKHFFHKSISCYKYEKLWGSNFLFILFRSFLFRITNMIKYLCCNTVKVPQLEE